MSALQSSSGLGTSKGIMTLLGHPPSASCSSALALFRSWVLIKWHPQLLPIHLTLVYKDLEKTLTWYLTSPGYILKMTLSPLKVPT